MKKLILGFGILGLCLLFSVVFTFAEDTSSEQTSADAASDSDSVSVTAASEGDSGAGLGTNWKDELTADKQAVTEQKQAMKGNAGAAKAEEKALKGQIRDAVQAEDPAAAKQLRGQLKSTHQENAAQRDQNKTDLKDAKNDLRGDRKAAFQERKTKKR